MRLLLHGILCLAIGATASAEWQLVPAAGLRLEDAALLLSGQHGGDLSVSVWGTSRVTAGGADVSFLVVLGSGALPEDPTGGLELTLYAVSSTGVNGWWAKDIRWSGADSHGVAGLLVAAHLVVNAPEPELRLLVRQRPGGQIGVASFRPGSADGLLPASLSLMLAAGPGSDPLLVEEGVAAEIIALATGASAIVQLEPEGALTMRVATRGVDPDQELVAVFFDGREAVAFDTFEPEMRRAVPGTTTAILEAEITEPGLAPGRYALRLVQEGNPALASPAVFLEVAGSRATDEARSEIPAQAVGPRTARFSMREGSRRLEESYSRLIEGDLPGTATALAALEAEALAAAPDNGPRLADAERQLVAKLSEADPDWLLPLLELRLQVFDLHRAARNTLAVLHANDRVTELARELAASGAFTASQLAADGLVEMASALLDSGLEGLAMDAFELAAELDPSHRGAVTALAFEAERRGRYSEAAEVLGGLGAAPGCDPEIRLRLALLQARNGTPQAGREALGRLLSDRACPPPPWIAALARQQLAEALWSLGESGQAEDLLRAALREAPGDQKIRLQLALLLDLSRRPEEATELLTGLLTTADDLTDARLRYGERPPIGTTGRLANAASSFLSRLGDPAGRR